jgi:hypothetical protein
VLRPTNTVEYYTIYLIVNDLIDCCDLETSRKWLDAGQSCLKASQDCCLAVDIEVDAFSPCLPVKDHAMTRLKLPATRSLALCFMFALGGASLSGCQALLEQVPLKPAAAQPTKAAVAQPSPAEVAGMIAPMVEKRETLTASGYAVISVQNHRNPAQQRLLAIRASKLDAYRSLTEQVYGQQLDASTTVADMVVQNDSFRTRVEGVIYGAVLVSITPTSDDTYETTLSLDKAVVKDLRTLYLGQIVAKNR